MNYRRFECCHLQDWHEFCDECGGSMEMIRDLEGEAAQALLGGLSSFVEEDCEDV